MKFTLFPWWFKLLIKIVLSRLPISYKRWKIIGIFSHGAMSNEEYSINVCNNHIRDLKINNDLKDKLFMEIGPGDSLSSAVLLYQHDAKSILIDSGDYATDDLNFYNSLIRQIKFDKDRKRILEHIKSRDQLLKICRSKYFTNGLKDLKKIPSNSVDHIFSQAVLEHIKKDEFIDTIKELYRITKKNGSHSHEIDFKDHLSGSINNLRFSEKVWESNLFYKSGFYTNRIRYSTMINYMVDCGFSIKIINKKIWNILPLEKNKLHNDFQKHEDINLKTYECRIVLTK